MRAELQKETADPREHLPDPQRLWSFLTGRGKLSLLGARTKRGSADTEVEWAVRD